MNLETISIKNFLKKSDSIYKNIMIISKRARQIIDDRYEMYKVEENIEDSDQLSVIEEIDDVDYNQPKPIIVALKEFMDDDLDWKEVGSDEDGTEE
ncbi:MAG: hypothetical protein CMG64_06300 [Candidatus Marinimicrobia bacterium]|nr:hypothetical protein [Candidatus Neomarinimicrobiota bacterium]|tara:strand:- start:10498 stop:10785 length:288 start_codon:yes stop_codon:yes gene_type:complete